MSLFALLNPALDLVYPALTGLDAVVQPLTGSAAVAVSLVLVTLFARLCLVPLAVRVLRAERARQLLAPELARLRRRFGSDQARLSKELLAAHRSAGVSPVAGLLPALLQAPVMLVVYRLCQVPVIAGAQNVVLAAQLFGVPLAGHAPAVIAAAGLFTMPTLVIAVGLVVLLVLGYLTSTQQVRKLRATGAEVSPVQLTMARVLPFGTAAALLVAPLAVGLYLVTSTTWLVAERALLPRLF